jgi:hypothetical protein
LNSQLKLFEKQFAFCMLLIFLIVNLSTLGAQSRVLIPFREGNLFGLANLEGKIVLKACYDNLQIMGGGYFQYWKKIKDNLKNEEEDRYEIGVLRGDKPIIQEEGLSYYVYLSQGLIVGNTNQYSGANTKFFNQDGKPFFSESFIGCKGINPESSPKENPAPLAFLVKHLNQAVSILIFDPNTKSFTKPLLDQVTNFSFEPAEVPRFLSVCRYYDANNNYHKDILYFNVVTQQHVCKPYEGFEAIKRLYESEEVNPNAKLKNTEPPLVNDPIAKPFFNFTNPKVVRLGALSFTLQENQKVIPIYQGAGQEQLPIIQHHQTYQLMQSNLTLGSEVYDSLVYVKQVFMNKGQGIDWCYLAAKKTAQGKLLWGVLNEQGEVGVPMIYDSIGFELPESYFRSQDGNQGTLVISNATKYPFYASYVENKLLGLFLVKKNGKYGLVDLEHQILIPIQSNKIWRNRTFVPSNLNMEGSFYVYQKEDVFGAFQLSLAGEKVMDTGPVFTDIPMAFTENYMDIKGLNLFYVYKNNLLYYGFASNKGKCYYR